MRYNNLSFPTILIILSLTVLFPLQSHALFGLSGGKYQTIKAHNGKVQIPVKKIKDNKAHYFSYTDHGATIHFFVIKSSDGVIRAAFDACDVCYHAKKGYAQDGDFMVCNNCGMRFHSTRINVVKGGCNPAPLKRKIVDKHLVIATSDILSGGHFFQGAAQ